jgi:hypothetical protein
MEDKNMFFGIPTHLFESIFNKIIPDIVTEEKKERILKKLKLYLVRKGNPSFYEETQININQNHYQNHCFRSLLNVSTDKIKINFAYIVIHSPNDGLNFLNKFSSSLDNFANKFKKICDMNNEFSNKNL